MTLFVKNKLHFLTQDPLNGILRIFGIASLRFGLVDRPRAIFPTWARAFWGNMAAVWQG